MWEVCLKSPHGLDTISFDDSNNTADWVSDTKTNINDWISSKFHDISCDNWIVYNDEVVGQNVSSVVGHCKGVLMWNDREIKWLIHSCPNFPFAVNPICGLPESACIYGQSFICLSLQVSHIDDILRHLKIMNAHIYLMSPSASILYAGIEQPTGVFDVLKFTDDIWHVGKGRKWGQDLYEDGLSRLFGGGELVETWMRPKAPDTKNVDNIEEIKWPNGVSYTEEQDHSKYGFSLTGSKPWVFIGDINHQKSQSKRGGGGIIIRDHRLWQAFYSLVKTR